MHRCSNCSGCPCLRPCRSPDLPAESFKGVNDSTTAGSALHPGVQQLEILRHGHPDAPSPLQPPALADGAAEGAPPTGPHCFAHSIHGRLQTRLGFLAGLALAGGVEVLLKILFSAGLTVTQPASMTAWREGRDLSGSASKPAKGRHGCRVTTGETSSLIVQLQLWLPAGRVGLYGAAMQEDTESCCRGLGKLACCLQAGRGSGQRQVCAVAPVPWKEKRWVRPLIHQGHNFSSSRRPTNVEPAA